VKPGENRVAPFVEKIAEMRHYELTSLRWLR
jgi:hypothetical protein